jgi:4-hydroxy-2-oxoheptanedioate aldolase
MRANPVKQGLRAGQPVVGTWLSLASITAARYMARSGLAWLVVDMEHSLVDWETATHMFASIADAGCTALARVPSNRHDHIKRALDNGAHGVVVPMVNSRQEAEDAVSAARYPPVGTRSVGGNVHALNFGCTPGEYFARANDEVLVVLQCEHIRAVQDASHIYPVPGIDAVFVGPGDLAASMRSPDGKPPSEAAVTEALNQVLAACKRNQVPAGLHVSSVAEAQARIREGWQLLTISSDLGMMMEGAGALVRGLST